MTHPKRIEASRLAARWFLTYACTNGAKNGRTELDPVYKAVTENRDGPTPRAMQLYSSCGDLAHWLFWRLGVQLKHVNRQERLKCGGTFGYRAGANISQLSRLAVDLNAPVPYLSEIDSYDAGDVLVIWAREDTKDAHVVCVAGRFGNKVLPTAEYGQPGGALCNRQVFSLPNSESFAIGTRKAHIHLSLAAVLDYAAEQGALGDIDMDLLRSISADAAEQVQGLLNEAVA